jgi:hypothetical protein
MENLVTRDIISKDVNKILDYIDDRYENEHAAGVSVLCAALASYIQENSEDEHLSRNLEIAISALKAGFLEK